MVVRSATVTTKPPVEDDPSTPDVDESQQSQTTEEDSATTDDVDPKDIGTDEPTPDTSPPSQETATSSVSDKVALPDAPYSQEELEDLAVSLQRNGPFFLGNDVRSRESALGIAKSVLDSVVAMGWDKPTIQAETKDAIMSVYKADEDAQQRDSEKDMYREGRTNSDVPTTADLTQNTPQTGPTPSGTSSVPGALEDNPKPTDAGGESASTTTSTDPSNPPTTGEQEPPPESSSASEAETSFNP